MTMASGARPFGKILIVEDEPLLLTLLKEFVSIEGIPVDVAKDGVEALNKIKATKYDIVLTDIQMPRLSGNELCSAVKADPLTYLQPTRWIALTAHLPEDLKGPILRDFDDSFFKPISPTMLTAVLKKYLS